MLSSAAEFALDAISEVVSRFSSFGLFALFIGACLGFFIGRQDAWAQGQTCQNLLRRALFTPKKVHWAIGWP